MITYQEILEKIKWKQYRQYYYYGISLLLMFLIFVIIFKPFSGFRLPIDYSATRKEALVLFNRGEFPEAIKKLESLIERDPRDFEAKSVLALAYMLTGRYAEAEKLFKEVIDNDETNVSALYRLGVVSRYMGKIDQSVINLEKAVALMGDNVMFREEFVKSLNAAGKYDDAESEIKKIINHKKVFKERLPYYWEMLGDAYSKQDKKSEAAAAYKNALKLGGNERVQKKLDALSI